MREPSCFRDVKKTREGREGKTKSYRESIVRTIYRGNPEGGMMKLTKAWMKKNNACQEAFDAWMKEGCEPDVVKVLNRCMELGRFDWANWLIVRHMTYKQYVSYAVFAAEQVIEIYEKKCPDDDRPRKAIEAAKKCIENPSAKNKAAAGAAAGAASAAAWAAARAAMKKTIIDYGIGLLGEK